MFVILKLKIYKRKIKYKYWKKDIYSDILKNLGPSKLEHNLTYNFTAAFILVLSKSDYKFSGFSLNGAIYTTSQPNIGKRSDISWSLDWYTPVRLFSTVMDSIGVL